MNKDKKETRCANSGCRKKSITNLRGKNPKKQEGFKHISEITLDILEQLKSSRKDKDKNFDVTFLLHVMLVPHRVSMRRVIILKLYEHKMISRSQCYYLLSVFNLGAV